MTFTSGSEIGRHQMKEILHDVVAEMVAPTQKLTTITAMDQWTGLVMSSITSIETTLEVQE
jgi:hypothetical protein